MGHRAAGCVGHEKLELRRLGIGHRFRQKMSRGDGVAAEPDGVCDAPHTRGQTPSVPGVKMPWLSPQPISLGVRWPWGALRPPEVGIGGFGSCRRRGQRAPAKRNSPASAGRANWTDLRGRARAFECTNPRGKRFRVARARGAGAMACGMPAGGFPILYGLSFLL